MGGAVRPADVLPADGQGPLLPGFSEVSPDAQRLLDQEVRSLVDRCEEEVEELLRANRDRLDALVQALLEHETLDEPDAYRVAGIERPPSQRSDERPETVARDASSRQTVRRPAPR